MEVNTRTCLREETAKQKHLQNSRSSSILNKIILILRLANGLAQKNQKNLQVVVRCHFEKTNGHLLEEEALAQIGGLQYEKIS